VFFNTMRHAFSHVGIYVGDGKFIHSPRTGSQIRVEDMRDSYWQRRFDGARRVTVPAVSAAIDATSALIRARSCFVGGLRAFFVGPPDGAWNMARDSQQEELQAQREAARTRLPNSVAGPPLERLNTTKPDTLGQKFFSVGQRLPAAVGQLAAVFDRQYSPLSCGLLCRPSHR
jgi:hypothetical protein